MPTLFISYKRGTSAVTPLMERLRATHYRLWFDRDEIHLGDPDWQARIDQGVEQCGALILCLTPDACNSKPVQYEVKQAQTLSKPIFPIVLERLDDWVTSLKQVGLSEKQHTEDFTDVEQWDRQMQRLLDDLIAQGLRVTRHDLRRERGAEAYNLHRQYLTRLVERVGTLNLAQINPDQSSGVQLEDVYIDSPTGLSLSVEVLDWHVVDWWISQSGERRNRPDQEQPRQRPEELGYDRATLETLVGEIEQQIQEYRAKNPKLKPDEEYSRRNRWNNGTKNNVRVLQVRDIAAARDRLVLLGAPGSGKSTFAKYLTLCLAGEQLEDWGRAATLTQLGQWPHGALTPVYVQLRHFVTSKQFPADVKTQPTAAHLWNYIKAEIMGDSLRDYAADLQLDLEQGQAVLILDGLDEVPYPEGKLAERQQQLQSLAAAVNGRYEQSRVIVASRPYAYTGWTLPGFEAVTITDFEDRHRLELAQRLYRVAGLSKEQAEEKAQSLNQQLRPVDPALKDRPLFLTLMATVFLQGDEEGLPTRRGALYRQSILLLLDRWTQGKSDAPSLTEILGDKTVNDLYQRLAALAYEVHRNYGDQPDTPEIEELLLYKHLKPMGRHVAADLIPYLSENAGVLVSPGQDQERDVFHFAHRTFQEYLAATHIAAICTETDSYAQVRELMEAKPQVWRVPCQLVGDVLADTGRKSKVWSLIGDLLEDDAPESSDAPEWWSLWLAGQVAQEQELHRQEKLRRGERAVRSGLVEWLLALVETAQALPPVERADCGRVLSLLGDPRPGVGTQYIASVSGSTQIAIPDIVWGDEIPAGTYQIGGDEEAYRPLEAQEYTLKQPYRMAKYPVTYSQFQAFLDADDGFDNNEWWEGLTEEYRKQKMREQYFMYANHPRENVNWYQAVAFTRWLTARYRETGLLSGNLEIRLPTEKEWEVAARYPDGRKFPWRDEFDSNKANTYESGIGQTAAVGIYPLGQNPESGLYDLSGNVWEWCLTKYGSDDNNYGGSEARVLRGGSWGNRHYDSRAASRTSANPHLVLNRGGFRLVAAAPVM